MNPDTISPEATTSAWNLPRILRGIGSIVLIMSLSSFLLQGWDQVDDVTRYLMLLAETITLGIAGLISIKWLNEPQGARTFVGLTLIAVPVNFAILGGMIYSPYLAGTGITESIPEYLRWQASDLWTAILVAAGSMLALLPLSLIGYRIMARQSATSLASLFILLNSALLIPVRSGVVVNVLLLVLTIVTLSRLHSLRGSDLTLRTPTGRFARASLLLPLAILFGRTLWIYGGDLFLTGVASFSAFLIIRHASVMLDSDSAWRPVVNLASLIPAMGAIIQLGEVLLTYFHITTAVQLPLMSIMASAVLVDCSTRSAYGNAYLRLAAVSAVSGALLGLFAYGSAFNVIWVMLVGIATIVYGTSVKHKSIFALGIATTATGLLYELHNVFSHFDIGSWSAMAAIGIATVISASLIERHGEAIKARIRLSYEKFSDWQF